MAWSTWTAITPAGSWTATRARSKERAYEPVVAPELPQFTRAQDLWASIDDHFMTHAVNSVNEFLRRIKSSVGEDHFRRATTGIREMSSLAAVNGFFVEDVLGPTERMWAQARGTSMTHQTVILPPVIRTSLLPEMFWFINQSHCLPAGSTVDLFEDDFELGARVSVPGWGEATLVHGGGVMHVGERGFALEKQSIRTPKLRHYLQVAKMVELTGAHPDLPNAMKLVLPLDEGTHFKLGRKHHALEFFVHAGSKSAVFTSNGKDMPASVEKAWIRHLLKDENASAKKVRSALGECLAASSLGAPA